MRTTTRQQVTRQPLVRFPILVGLVLVFALGAAACSATRTSQDQPGSPGQGRLVDIGGRRLYLECQGTGTPVAVFVAGLGRSDPGPTRTSYQRAANDLHALLGAGPVQGPYLLVGHSLGGLLARLYVHDHPAEVAGLVLVDGTPVGWFPTVQRLLPVALRGPLAHNPEGFDLSHGLASLTPLDRPAALGRRPLAVLWAPNQPPTGLPAATAEELGRRREAEQARLGRLSGASRLQRVAAGHYLQRDQPQLVIDAINQVLCAAQRAAASS